MKPLIGVGGEVLVRPEGCQCPDGWWCVQPKEACDNYEPRNKYPPYPQPGFECAHCEHDQECHREQTWN